MATHRPVDGERRQGQRCRDMSTSGHRKAGSGNDSTLPSVLTALRIDAHQGRSSQVYGLHPVLGAEG